MFQKSCFCSVMATSSLPFSPLSFRMPRKSHYQLIKTAQAQFPIYSLAINQKRLSEHKGCVNRSIQPKENMWKLCCNKRPIELGGSEPESDHLLASSTIEQFYSSINDKDMDKIKGLIAEKCDFDELSFPHPFQKKKDVIHFLTELADAMGKNVKFKIEVSEGGEHTAGVKWHLEWMGKDIPFTKGCGFYECTKEGESLVIKKARIAIEAPVKPGAFVLKLLKIITSLFDQFPHLTERFLLKPHIVIQFLLKIYKIFIEPTILPLLVYYTHLWTFAARLLSYFLKILLKIVNLFR